MSRTHTTTFESNMADAGLRVLEGNWTGTVAALARAATEADTEQREWLVGRRWRCCTGPATGARDT
jgi:hypothetical protein